MVQFTRKEVSDIFGVKPRTVWHWEKKGIIKPCTKINGRPRYSVEDIEAAQLKTSKK